MSVFVTLGLQISRLGPLFSSKSTGNLVFVLGPSLVLGHFSAEIPVDSPSFRRHFSLSFFPQTARGKFPQPSPKTRPKFARVSSDFPQDFLRTPSAAPHSAGLLLRLPRRANGNVRKRERLMPKPILNKATTRGTLLLRDLFGRVVSCPQRVVAVGGGRDKVAHDLRKQITRTRA